MPWHVLSQTSPRGYKSHSRALSQAIVAGRLQKETSKKVVASCVFSLGNEMQSPGTPKFGCFWHFQLLGFQKASGSEEETVLSRLLSCAAAHFDTLTLGLVTGFEVW